MTAEQPAIQQPANTPDRTVRPVVEHALTDYGYSADTARTLIDRLIAESGNQ